MAEQITAVDVSDSPDLLRLAEEVHRSGQPRLLRRGGEDLAILTPAPAAQRRIRRPRTYTKADDDAFLASAGGWQGNVDVDKFLRDNEESRRLSTSERAPEL